MTMRKVIVESKSNWGESGEMKFQYPVQDSEALHELLCRIDPGMTYTVAFSDVEE